MTIDTVPTLITLVDRVHAVRTDTDWVDVWINDEWVLHLSSEGARKLNAKLAAALAG